MLVERERDSFERAALDRARVMMTAIDAEFRASITPLEMLARSPALDHDDLDSFRPEAERALEARRGDWSNIVVSHPDTTEMMMNLRAPSGALPLKVLDPGSIGESAESRKPSIGIVVTGRVIKRPVFAVRVPVIRDDKVKYVLSAVVETSVISKLIERQGFPSTWYVAVIDGGYEFVARQPMPDKGLGSPSASLKKALDSAPQGFQRGQLSDGTEIYRSFQRSALSRWSTSIAVPRSVVEQSLNGVYVLVAGLAGAVMLGLWIAWWLASRISQPISALARAAPALGRGEAAALPPVGAIDEVRELGRALGESAVAIRDREERQRHAEHALRTADRAKDEFLAMLGHELRNPLASVSNAAQLLKMARDQPQVLESVSAILGRQVEQMTRLVDDLLEVGRVTGGKVRLQREALDLAVTVVRLLNTWKTDGRLMHHDVSTDLQSAWVFADPTRIEQILSNLLDNSLKYTPAGGKIHISLRINAANAELEISDTGLGMPPELIDRVFDLFVQGERSLAREPGGLGIGLTMVKRLVELHGGTVRAKSDGPNSGATFTVELPAIDRPEAIAVTSTADKIAAPRQVVIIEDDDDARDTLAELLRLDSHHVSVARNGTEGVQLVHSSAPEFVLVDIGLPDINGYEVARRLRSDPATSHLQLIAVTGYGTQEDRRAALAAGFNEHLAKPIELAFLKSLLCNSPVASCSPRPSAVR